MNKKCVVHLDSKERGLEKQYMELSIRQAMPQDLETISDILREAAFVHRLAVRRKFAVYEILK